MSVFCFLLLQLVFGVFSVVDLILWAADIRVISLTTPDVLWMYYFYIACLFAGPMLYTVTVYFTYSLYKEMKIVLDEMVSGLQSDAAAPGGGGAMMGSGYDVQPPTRAREDRAQLWRHAESHPQPPPAAAPAPARPQPSSGGGGGGGFQAFTGTGRKLGQ